MQVSGVAVLYHPNEDEVIRNIKSYIDYVSTLIVFDNSNCSNDFVGRVKSISPKIVYVSNAENEGIAKPLNKALEITESEWLLTMDQDSYFEPQYATTYFDSFRKAFCDSENVAIVCPNHSSDKRLGGINNEFKDVVRAITSGSIINTGICRQLNGFNEKLFIDEVDFEYCYRCIIAGYRIIQFDNIYLNHALGIKKDAGYFSVFKKSGRSIHSPLRVYYMVRNFLYVSSNYKKYLPEEMKKRKKELYVTLKNNLLFSGNFFKTLLAVIKGYLHFKLNRFSS